MFIDAINNDKMKLTKLIAVSECQNLFLPVVLRIVKYELAVPNKNIKNNVTGKNIGTAVTTASITGIAPIVPLLKFANV